MTGKRLAFASLKRASGASLDLLAAHLENDRLEFHAAALEEICDRLVKLGGAALLVSDLRALLADYQAVAEAENNARARAAWVEAHRRPEGDR